MQRVQAVVLLILLLVLFVLILLLGLLFTKVAYLVQEKHRARPLPPSPLFVFLYSVAW